MKKSNHQIIVMAAACLCLIVLGSCGGSRKIIMSSGLRDFKLGMQMPPQGTERLERHNARDTFVEQGEFQWREIVLDYRKGKVYLEEDFYGSDHLSRVRIYTPELATRNGLRVGMAVSDLLANASDWILQPLPDHNLIDAYSLTMPHIHFLIDDPSVPKTGEWQDYALSKLAPTAKIAIIVVF